MSRPLYKFKKAFKLPDSLKFRVFEEVRGAFESLDGNVFVVPKNKKDVFEREEGKRTHIEPNTTKEV